MPTGAVDNGSVVEVVRFPLNSVELEDDGMTAMFRLERARLVVDTSYSELAAMQRDIKQGANKQPYRG